MCRSCAEQSARTQRPVFHLSASPLHHVPPIMQRGGCQGLENLSVVRSKKKHNLFKWVSGEEVGAIVTINTKVIHGRPSHVLAYSSESVVKLDVRTYLYGRISSSTQPWLLLGMVSMCACTKHGAMVGIGWDGMPVVRMEADTFRSVPSTRVVGTKRSRVRSPSRLFSDDERPKSGQRGTSKKNEERRP